MLCIKAILRRTLLRPLQRHNSFLSGTSSTYIEDMYNAWQQDPSSVHKSWDSYFRHNSYQAPPSLATPGPHEEPLVSVRKSEMGRIDATEIDEMLRVQAIIRSYQARGHLVANLDPLGIMYTDKTTTFSEQMGTLPHQVAKHYRVDHIDKNKVFKLPMTTFIGGDQKELPLQEIIRRLELAYCRHIGVEFMYVNDYKKRMFIREMMERPGVMEISRDQKRLLLSRLMETTEFELFLARKWTSVKRFGIEGCDMAIPAIRQIIDRCSDRGVDHFVIALAHRGRLNVLANVCKKPFYQIFTQFANLEPNDIGSGDVKYHLGAQIERLNRANNKQVKLTVVANPSHLEASNGVALGRTRAEQFYRGDLEGAKVMTIMVHGDASFCGQGVVYESIHLSALPCYTTHGAIHLVINNQIGFTTDPRHSRSSRYCSDVGHVVNAPIFHVNGDDPESVLHVCNVAAEWRTRFRQDIVIDVVGYRRNGHNEADEPMFTQPLMYTKIRALEPVFDKYARTLIDEGVITEAEVAASRGNYVKMCEEQYTKASQEKQLRFTDWLDSPWSGFFSGRDPMKVASTGVKEDILVHIGKKFSAPPPAEMEFVLHKGIERILKQRQDLVKARTVDWSLGEAMAFGSLVKEGVHVRLSGQDVERGTFSHRHHVLHHQTLDNVTYNPLCHMFPDQAPYVVCNSSLSEYGVLGFETGFALTNPNSLVLWEAQFGDFANTAQCLIDTYLSSGETKWVRQSGIALLLPHGYEGMGPEHSCARSERFLQMCDDDPDVIPEEGPYFAIKQLNECNWIVANCTTPANIFHILRRQVALPFRKPLILCTPKSLLRLPEARSSFDEMLEGTEFRRVIPDDGEASHQPDQVKKLILCSGKVYYDIYKARKERGLTKDIAVSRVEQLSPFPYDLVRTECDKYANATLCWAQEEPKNYGGYNYVLLRMQTLLQKRRDVAYAGRPVAAATATGTRVVHDKELENLLNDSLAI